MEFESMPDHHLIDEDIQSAILGGRIMGRRKEPLGTQYLVEGPTLDDRMITTVIQFGTDEYLLVVTAYE